MFDMESPPTIVKSVVESADSGIESAYSTVDSAIIPLKIGLWVSLRETRPLRTFDFGKRAIKVCKCDGKVTFTIPFQDIYLFIKGDLAQHQERSYKGNFSITINRGRDGARF